MRVKEVSIESLFREVSPDTVLTLSLLASVFSPHMILQHLNITEIQLTQKASDGAVSPLNMNSHGVLQLRPVLAGQTLIFIMVQNVVSI